MIRARPTHRERPARLRVLAIGNVASGIMSDDVKPSRETGFNNSASSRVIRSMFGQTLRQLHEVPRETPHHLLVILMQLEESSQPDPPAEGPTEQ
jgi:hypothetical protein